jgi:hypothetical protein
LFSVNSQNNHIAPQKGAVFDHNIHVFLPSIYALSKPEIQSNKIKSTISGRRMRMRAVRNEHKFVIVVEAKGRILLSGLL